MKPPTSVDISCPLCDEKITVPIAVETIGANLAVVLDKAPMWAHARLMHPDEMREAGGDQPE